MTRSHATTAADPDDELAITGISCPELCASYGVDVREFVLLACLKELGVATTDALTDLLGLSPTTLDSCLTKLLENGLIRLSGDDTKTYSPTLDGLVLLRKADTLKLDKLGD
jgi:DNA-binding MarR family transcriptional regulator